jgi:long-chain acyl-CoA synthetase
LIEPATLPRLLEAGVRLRPKAPAIVFEGKAYSYEQLERRVNACARGLSKAGLVGERVGLMLPNSIELVCWYLACFCIGAVAAPISSSYAGPELARALDVARPKWLVADASHRGLLAELNPEAFGLRRILIAGEREDWFGAPADAAASDPAAVQPPELAALLFFTSGSTGKPKGVQHSQRSAMAILTSTFEALDGVDANDIILVCEPQVHPSGFIATFSVLSRGGTVTLLAGFDEVHYLAALRARPPSLIVTHIDILTKLLRAPDIRPEDFAALRGVYTGGDVVPPARQRQFWEFTGLPIQVGWGMTEAIWVTVCRTPDLERQGCIGRPVGGAQIRVAGEDGKRLPDGETGEFWVKGPMVMREYWHDPDTTARAFADGWFRTGDSGWRDADGTYWFAARIKDIIVRNTAKLTPGEVEAALDQHPGVQSAAVIGAPDPDAGDVRVAFVVPEPGWSLMAAALTEFLETKIADIRSPSTIILSPRFPSQKAARLITMRFALCSRRILGKNRAGRCGVGVKIAADLLLALRAFGKLYS